MSYKVEFDELDAFSNQLQANVKLWLQMLQSVGESAESLSKSGNMGGAGAENIRAYVTNVHLSLVSALMKLLSMHEYNAINYQNDYESNIDSDLHAVIHASELKNIRLRTETERRRSLQIDEAVNYTLNGIRDIFSLTCPNVFNVDQAHQTVIRRIDTLDQDILDLERRHSGDDFAETGDLIRTMQAFVSEMLGQGRSYKEGFTPEQLVSSESFRAMYYSVLAVDKRLDEKADEIEAAIENQNERLKLLQEEYEERQRKATIIKWVVTGVCVVGSVVAIGITGGAATPLVVGAISAASGAVIAGTNNLADQYVERGTLRGADLGSFGVDVLVGGATGFVTGYLGASVGQALTTAARGTQLGGTLLNSTNGAVRFGTGAVIGSFSEVGSGIVTRGASSATEQLIREGKIDFEEVGEAALDPKNIVVDATIGGISGGAGEYSKFKAEQKAKHSFTGTLKGEEITLDDVTVEEMDYVKRSDAERDALRDEFNTKTRKEFLKELGNDPDMLREAGFSEADILKIQDGGVPKGWQVHHKYPLDDSGTNDYGNLVLIKNEPYHKVLTNYQNGISRTMEAGQSATVDWPVPNGSIYPFG
jgi:hypothetical protein